MIQALLAFIHIEKTAGTTLAHILRSSYGIRHCEVWPLGKQKDVFKPFSPDDLRLTLRLHPAGLRSIAGHSVTPYMGLEQVRPLRYFTFLREPLKQCTSYYQYLVDRHGKSMDFERWIAQEWPRNMQCKRLAGVADAGAAIQIIAAKEIFVGLVEQFDASLALLKALQAPDLNLFYQPRNIAPRQSLAQELLSNPGTLEMLAAATAEDQKVYRYATETLFPRQQAQAAGLAGREGKQGRENKRNQAVNRVYRNLVYKPGLSIAERVSRGEQ